MFGVWVQAHSGEYHPGNRHHLVKPKAKHWNRASLSFDEVPARHSLCIHMSFTMYPHVTRCPHVTYYVSTSLTVYPHVTHYVSTCHSLCAQESKNLAAQLYEKDTEIMLSSKD